MKKNAKSLTTRIGICRSGIPFDLPDDLSEDLAGPYFNKFEIQDRVDIFCMCEATIRRATNSAVPYVEYKTIKILSTYLWSKNVFTDLEPNLIEVGLRTSTDYVRHGQPLLIPWLL